MIAAASKAKYAKFYLLVVVLPCSAGINPMRPPSNFLILLISKTNS